MADWRAANLTLSWQPHQQMYAGCLLPPVTTSSSILYCKTVDQQTTTVTVTYGLKGLASGQALL